MEEKNKEPKNASQKPYQLEPNAEAALAYVLGPITGAIVYYYEKDNKFIRFHAMQSIIFGLAFFLASIIVSAVPIVGWIIAPFVTIGGFVIWILLLWKAYNNEEWELPYIGKIARDQLNK